MRRIVHLCALYFAATVVSACKPDELVKTETIPTAGVRFINAVPDTGGAFGMDFRFVDIVESNAAFRIAFRNNPQTSGGVVASTGIEYKNARAGSRHFRIFLDDTLQSIASIVLKDSTLNLEADHKYTVLLWGNSRSTGADRMRLTVIDETVGDPGNSVALRVINATGSALDVSIYAASNSGPPSTPTWANVGAYTISDYKGADPQQIRYNVRPAGSGTNLFSDALALIGQPIGTQTSGCTVGVDCEALPGTTAKGSAITAIIFPRSVAGSKAPQATSPVNFTVPVASFMWDRRPARAFTAGC
jgi:hypothetical protein